MKKNAWKLLLDLAMVVVLVLMYNHRALGLAFHEIGGLILLGVFVIHVVLNRRWVAGVSKKLFKKGLSVRTRISCLLTILMIISFAVTGVTGVLISKVVFHFNVQGTVINVQGLHIGAAAFALVIAGIHLGMHYQFIKTVLGKKIHPPKPLVQAIQIVLCVLFIGYGAYSVTTNNFLEKLERPFVTQQGVNFQGGQGNTQQGGDFQGGQGNTQQSGSSDSSQQHGPQNGNMQKGDFSGQKPDFANGGAPDGAGGQTGVTSALDTILNYLSITLLFASLTALAEALIQKLKRKKQA